METYVALQIFGLKPIKGRLRKYQNARPSLMDHHGVFEVVLSFFSTRGLAPNCCIGHTRVLEPHAMHPENDTLLCDLKCTRPPLKVCTILSTTCALGSGWRLHTPGVQKSFTTPRRQCGMIGSPIAEAAKILQTAAPTVRHFPHHIHSCLSVVSGRSPPHQ